MILYSNNTFEVRQISQTEDSVQLQEIMSCENMGHQAVVRSLAFSQDDTMLMSSSADVVKIWSTLMSYQSVRTIQLSDIMSCTFLPYQKYACLGSRSGDLHLVNTATGVVEFTKEKAHD